MPIVHIRLTSWCPAALVAGVVDVPGAALVTCSAEGLGTAGDGNLAAAVAGQLCLCPHTSTPAPLASPAEAAIVEGGQDVLRGSSRVQQDHGNQRPPAAREQGIGCHVARQLLPAARTRRLHLDCRHQMSSGKQVAVNGWLAAQCCNQRAV